MIKIAICDDEANIRAYLSSLIGAQSCPCEINCAGKDLGKLFLVHRLQQVLERPYVKGSRVDLRRPAHRLFQALYSLPGPEVEKAAPCIFRLHPV